MIKGSCVLKPSTSKRWVKIFDTWIKSGHIAVVIHCDSKDQVRNVNRSANEYQKNHRASFWTKMEGTDLYLIRSNAVKDCAMEVRQERNGVIYFYDTAKAI